MAVCMCKNQLAMYLASYISGIFRFHEHSTQVHETTGHSPYKLVFGQKPHTKQFAEGVPSLIKEEDLEPDGVVFEDENVNYAFTFA